MLLVSLCNVGEQDKSALLAVDLHARTIRPLPLVWGTGATGLCRIGEFILVAHQTPEASIGLLDARTLEFRAEVPLRDARDAHSVVAWQGGVAVASTGTDEILWYRYDGTEFTDRRVLWSSGLGRRDIVHLNGLAACGETLVGCGFGPRRSETDLWSEAHDGFVYDITHQKVLLGGLGHPHSIAFFDGDVYLCESSRRRFRSLERPIAELNGYTRGVAPFDHMNVVVGTSRGRLKSRSAGRLLNPADEGIEAGECALHLVGMDGEIRASLSLAEYGREVYDILSVEAER